MGRKHVIKIDMFKDLSADMSGSLTSREIDVSELDKASIHCKWVAGPEGEFQIQAKNYDQLPITDSWYTLETGTAWSVVAADSEAQIVLNELPFVRLRLVWVPTSGSGTLISYLSSKSTGA